MLGKTDQLLIHVSLLDPVSESLTTSSINVH